MAKGAASKDKKSTEKKSGDKGKGKAEDSADKGGGKVLAWLDYCSSLHRSSVSSC